MTKLDTPAPVSGPGTAQPDNRKWYVLLAVGIGTFMSALDGSIMNTVLPIVRADFQAGIAQAEWVTLMYLLVVSGLLLTFGRLGDLRGNRPVYLSGFGVFVAASMLCGLAPSIEWLIFFRGLQALGSAMLFSSSPAILTRSFPASQRGQALGLQATMTYLGLTVGPSLGGWLTQTFSWRAVFYINVPVGLLAMAVGWIFVSREHEPKAEGFDFAGALLFIAGLVSLLLALNNGQEWGWGSLPVMGLLIASVVFLGAFILVEGRMKAPMLDLSLFKSTTFSASALSAVLNYVALFVVLFLMPFYLIQGRALNPAEAGLILTAQPIVMAITAPLSGTLSDRIGTRMPALVGMLILAAGLFALAQLTADTQLGWIAAGLAVCGLGTGLFASPNNSALMGSAPRHRQGIAAAVLATARNVGMVLGIGIGGAILTTYAATNGDHGVFLAIQTGLLVASGAALGAGLSAALRGRDQVRAS